MRPSWVLALLGTTFLLLAALTARPVDYPPAGSRPIALSTYRSLPPAQQRTLALYGQIRMPGRAGSSSRNRTLRLVLPEALVAEAFH